MHIKLLKEQCSHEQLWMLIFAEINSSWIFQVKCTQLLKMLVCLTDAYQAAITVLISLEPDLLWTSIISNIAKAEFTMNLKSLQTQLSYTLEVCTFSEKLLVNWAHNLLKEMNTHAILCCLVKSLNCVVYEHVLIERVTEKVERMLTAVNMNRVFTQSLMLVLFCFIEAARTPLLNKYNNFKEVL